MFRCDVNFNGTTADITVLNITLAHFTTGFNENRKILPAVRACDGFIKQCVIHKNLSEIKEYRQTFTSLAIPRRPSRLFQSFGHLFQRVKERDCLRGYSGWRYCPLFCLLNQR